MSKKQSNDLSFYNEYEKCALKLSKCNGLKIGHLNVRILYGKIDEIRFLITKINIDILCLTETWLHDMICDREVQIDGYVLIRRDRNINKKGGGVCIFIHNTISFSERSDLLDDIIEAAWIELTLKSTQIIIGCMYRPPNSDCNYFNKMLDIFGKITSEDKDLVILGDFNYDYKTDIISSENPLNMIENLFSLTQMIHKPTRVTSTSSKCLDHIFTTIPNRHTINDVAKISLSDHYLIYTCINSKNNHNVVCFRNYNNFDINAFTTDLKNCETLSNTSVNSNSLNEMWSEWKHAFLKCCNKHAPIKESRVKNRHCPWMTSDVIKLIYQRDYLKKQYDKLNIHSLLLEYRELRNNITKLIRRKKREYFDSVSDVYVMDSRKL